MKLSERLHLWWEGSKFWQHPNNRLLTDAGVKEYLGTIHDEVRKLEAEHAALQETLQRVKAVNPSVPVSSALNSHWAAGERAMWQRFQAALNSVEIPGVGHNCFKIHDELVAVADPVPVTNDIHIKVKLDIDTADLARKLQEAAKVLG